jgi:serine/threonine-protein kinase
MDSDWGVRRVGRYRIHEALAAGGMASVHYGQMLGLAGFSRTVAIKRLHPHLARDPEFVAMLLDEARLAARIQHPNVVATVDVVADDGELLLVMEYVRGESLSGLFKAANRRSEAVPIPILSAILAGALHGLHAAHEARSDSGQPLEIVHRDVSPQNILVGADGIARIADFGVAKGLSRLQSTDSGQVKGKLGYMAPEQLLRKGVDRRTDLHAAGIVLWEGLVGRKLHRGDDAGEIMGHVLQPSFERPSVHRPEVSPELDALVLRALNADPAARFGSAAEMAAELERVAPPAPQTLVAEWVSRVASDVLSRRSERLAEIEASSDVDVAPTPVDPRPAEEATEIRVDVAEATQGGISTAGPAPRPAGSRRWIAVGAVAIVLLLGAAGFYARSHAATPNAVAPPAESTAASTTTIAITAPPTLTTIPPPSATPSVTASSAPLLATAPVKTVAHPVHSAKPAASSCDPPYTLDPVQRSPLGEPVKHFKPWCL